MSAKPYSTATLADHWGCSPQNIRNMIRDGQLRGFTIGKLIRIPAAEVERIECQNIPSQDIGASGLSPSQMVDELGASRLERMTGDSQRLEPFESGKASISREARG